MLTALSIMRDASMVLYLRPTAANAARSDRRLTKHVCTRFRMSPFAVAAEAQLYATLYYDDASFHFCQILSEICISCAE